MDTLLMAPDGEYAPSPVPWVREEVEHLERTGAGLRGRAVVLLTTAGARTGLLRKTPLMRVTHAGVYAIVASMAGSDRHPHWYANVLAEPRVTLRDGDEVLSLVARAAAGAERSAWWSRACTVFPSYVGYQSRTRRQIPLLLLEPAPAQPAPAPGHPTS
ncbi:nitroreductase family deazaflavin-dependent oxidoreductase [Blastococcus sp. CT_GayMR16]|uniref:nitroreductase family deazaflavin-dependent oxidoreductase n=1 Tax=Blastococcus sp. CT_GayMR16 TaxID=2559607 RepID=UPI001FD77519|nr:nitroreductase family deazaflavin-dependent oxidoreductase [Blastococcus sp. CT_GayMR16]